MKDTIHTLLTYAILACIGIVISLVGVQCFVSNGLSEEGKKIFSMEKEIEILKKENGLLSESIASASSMIAIRQKALEMGLTDSHVTISLGDFPVAARTIR